MLGKEFPTDDAMLAYAVGSVIALAVNKQYGPELSEVDQMEKGLPYVGAINKLLRGEGSANQQEISDLRAAVNGLPSFVTAGWTENSIEDLMISCASDAHGLWRWVNAQRFQANDKKYCFLPFAFLGWNGGAKCFVELIHRFFEMIGVPADIQTLEKAYRLYQAEEFSQYDLASADTIEDVAASLLSTPVSITGFGTEELYYVADLAKIRQELEPQLAERGCGSVGRIASFAMSFGVVASGANPSREKLDKALSDVV